MMLNFIQRLSQRTKNVVGNILSIFIILSAASLIMCLVFGAIGSLAKLPIMTSLAGYCFLVFLVTAVVLIAVAIIPLTCFIIATTKRDGLRKLLIRHTKTFMISIIIAIAAHFIIYKNQQWGKLLEYTLLTSLLMFLRTEVAIFIKETGQGQALNDSPDEGE